MLFNFIFDYRYIDKDETVTIPAPTLACAERMLRINATEGRAREMANIEIKLIRCESVIAKPAIETKDEAKTIAPKTRATKRK